MTRLLFAIVFAVLAGIAGARAQSFPSKQVTMIVPFPAGGGSDILARIVAERMRADGRKMRGGVGILLVLSVK